MQQNSSEISVQFGSFLSRCAQLYCLAVDWVLVAKTPQAAVYTATLFYMSFITLPLLHRMSGCLFFTGEEENSWGYGGTAKFSTNNKFSNFGRRFAKGDVVMAMVDFESRPPKISFAVNGDFLGVAQPLHGYKVGNTEFALFPHVLSKNSR